MLNLKKRNVLEITYIDALNISHFMKTTYEGILILLDKMEAQFYWFAHSEINSSPIKIELNEIEGGVIEHVEISGNTIVISVAHLGKRFFMALNIVKNENEYSFEILLNKVLEKSFPFFLTDQENVLFYSKGGYCLQYGITSKKEYDLDLQLKQSEEVSMLTFNAVSQLLFISTCSPKSQTLARIICMKYSYKDCTGPKFDLVSTFNLNTQYYSQSKQSYFYIMRALYSPLTKKNALVCIQRNYPFKKLTLELDKDDLFEELKGFSKSFGSVSRVLFNEHNVVWTLDNNQLERVSIIE